MKITHKIETITPAKAEKYLLGNQKNRPVKSGTLEKYIKQLNEDQWKVNGETICFSDTGKLMNGQHRLLACVETGKSFRTLVVRGLDESVQTTYDTGSVRTAADVLAMNEVSHAKIIAPAVPRYMAIVAVEEGEVTPTKVRWAKGTMTNEEILESVLEDPKGWNTAAESVSDGEAGAILKPRSLFCAIYYRLAYENKTRTKEFFEHLVDGTGIEKDSPIYKLRQCLIRWANTDLKRDKKPTLGTKAAVTIKAYNAWMEGEEVKKLRFLSNEGWPIPVRKWVSR